MTVKECAVAHDDVFAAEIPARHLLSRLDRNIVVTYVDQAAGDHDVLAIARVDGVSVGGTFRGADRHMGDEHPLALRGYQMKFWGILQRNVLNLQVFATQDPDQIGARQREAGFLLTCLFSFPPPEGAVPIDDTCSCQGDFGEILSADQRDEFTAGLYLEPVARHLHPIRIVRATKQRGALI